jgi:hypothetical protein
VPEQRTKASNQMDEAECKESAGRWQCVTDEQNGSAGLLILTVILCSLVLILTVVFLKNKCKKWVGGGFHFMHWNANNEDSCSDAPRVFISHHKRDAGGEARLLKMMFLDREITDVFLDSDNLDNL